jgi:hypothetical protein
MTFGQIKEYVNALSLGVQKSARILGVRLMRGWF